MFDLSDRKFPFEGFGFQGVIHVSNVGLEFLPHFFGRRYVADAAVRRGASSVRKPRYFAVQTEGQRHKCTAHPHARDKACHLIDPAHIKYDYENETASRPPAKRKRYCARSPLNSTWRPTPLLIGYSAIV